MTLEEIDIKNPLAVHNLSIGYSIRKKDNALLTNLNLSLRAGELVCFMGPNGIGKSTLIRTLAGIQKPLSGTIYYSGKNIGDRVSEKISVVLTDKVAIHTMSVYELITFGRYPYLNWTVTLTENDKKIIDDSIKQVHAEHLINKSLHELSDGQLQLAMIARALAQDGDIILLDEPTAHLDLNNRVEIMNLLRKIARQYNKAILVATHELDLALQTANLIWLAGKNKNILSGLPEDLVLNGAFDEIFQFKGFDLKTGKIQHEAYRNISVNVIGEGPELLWTKNALERNGFFVDNEANLCIQVVKEESNYTWLLSKNRETFSFSSLREILDSIS